MKRWWATALLGLLAGAGERRRDGGVHRARAAPGGVPPFYPPRCDVVFEQHRTGITERQWVGGDGGRTYMVQGASYGWPLRSFERTEGFWDEIWGLAGNDQLWRSPGRVVWTGALTNSGLYALPFWTMMAAGVVVRRRRERLRGRCPRCAYDLLGDLIGGCTECGWNREARA